MNIYTMWVLILLLLVADNVYVNHKKAEVFEVMVKNGIQECTELDKNENNITVYKKDCK